MDDITKKVVERFQDKTAMAVVIRDAPPTYNWGWFSREDQRMHVQTVDRQHIRLHYRAWLEDRGTRIFSPDKDIPPKITKELLKAIREQEESVEMEWVHLMIQNRWLTLQLESDQRHFTLTAYPNGSGKFQRRVDILDHFAGAGLLDEKDISLDERDSTIKVWGRQDIYLPSILWVGKR
jgi:hypothetical protein